MLVSLLDAHPRIRCESELLEVGRLYPNQFVEARAVKAALRGMDAFGWKLLVSQFRSPATIIRGIGDPETYPARLHAIGYRLIVLLRRNPVQQALSSIRAESSQFHHRRGDNATFVPITVDPVSLMARSWIAEAETSALKDAVGSVPSLGLTYEDDLLDVAQHQTTVDRVCDYLGIESSPVSTDLVKIAPPGIEESVTNVEEVWDLLKRSRYAPYLDATEARASETAT